MASLHCDMCVWDHSSATEANSDIPPVLYNVDALLSSAEVIRHNFQEPNISKDIKVRGKFLDLVLLAALPCHWNLSKI